MHRTLEKKTEQAQGSPSPYPWCQRKYARDEDCTRALETDSAAVNKAGRAQAQATPAPEWKVME
ncbi:hypothetical protein Mapa_012048 [Marchantia paleacea]|nr:hypothetical protein Mapa_012048 [Marchantia paleacea]